MVSTNSVMDTGTRSSALEENLQRELHSLQRRSLEDTSRHQYKSTWRQWCAFCPTIGRSEWLPEGHITAQSHQLVMFAVHRWDSPERARSVSTDYAQLSHIRWHHRVYFGFEPKINAGHAAVRTGMRRLGHTTRPRAPVSLKMLEWIAQNIDFEEPKQRLILGAALLGYFFTLRSSEYLAVRGGRHQYALEVRDIQVSDGLGQPTRRPSDALQVTINLRGSKTDQLGRGTTRSLRKSGRGRICPVAGALLLLDLSRHHKLNIQDSICSIGKGRMLKAETLSKVLKRAATACGAKASLFSCHSLRSGGATALIAGGVDSAAIMLHGRWKSATYQRYTRYADETGGPLAAVMAGTNSCHDLSPTRLRRISRHHDGVPSQS